MFLGLSDRLEKLFQFLNTPLLGKEMGLNYWLVALEFVAQLIVCRPCLVKSTTQNALLLTKIHEEKVTFTSQAKNFLGSAQYDNALLTK